MASDKHPVIVIDFAEKRFVTVPEDELETNEDLARARAIQERQELALGAVPVKAPQEP